MAAVANSNRKGMYSWWWDSHISPKNSKWLQENLTDMDVKVKQMIKLIEEDADSFARRAEMYYKKRPELMKLVEEFYRAYRALAERYDHATGALRQAHKTMSEAFPNQVALMLSDDSPGSSLEFDLRTPDMSEFLKDSTDLGSYVPAHKRNGAFNDSVGSAEGRARRGINFLDADDKEANGRGVSSQKSLNLPYSETVASAETEIQKLKAELAKLQAEKEAGLAQCQRSLEESSNLELKLTSAQEDCDRLKEQARLADAEVQSLKEALTKLEAEKNDHLLQYEQCMEKVANLENHVSLLQKDSLEFHERANDAEIKCRNLRQNICELEVDKEAADEHYKDCLAKILTLEDKLVESEENARNMSERAEKAESEVENLKEQLAKVFAEKEAVNLQYERCLGTISDLEHKISATEEETERLNAELKDGIAKLKGAEEKCLLLQTANQTLHLELESVAQKMANQTQEISEKQQELGKLWTSIQEERLRFVEAETAFQTLQHLHSKSLEELMSLNVQLQNRNQILNDMEIRNLGLEDEIRKVHQENQNLSELNVSSSLTIQNLQQEILSLREIIKKLEVDIELRVDERNALQQEIYCLKEELNDLNKKHQGVLDEKSEIKGKHDRECGEKAILVEKLAAMEALVEKNIVLENSLSDLDVELDAVREKVKSLEKTCKHLLEEKTELTGEKDLLVSKLQDTKEKFDNLIEKNILLENSLCDATVELEELKVKLKGVEESCLLLGGEKLNLNKEKEDLLSQLAVSHQRTEDLEMKKRELEESSSLLEEERKSGFSEIAKLKAALEAEMLKHASFTQSSKRELGDKEFQLFNLQEELQHRNDEYEKELERNFTFELDLLILHTSMQDLGERTSVLSSTYRKLEQVSRSYEEQILYLEQENLSKQVKMGSLSGQIEALQPRLCQMKKILLAGAHSDFGDNVEQDPILMDHIVSKVEDWKRFFSEAEEENVQLLIKNLVLNTLLKQMSLDLADVISERNALGENHRIQREQFVLLQRQEENAKDMVEELGLILLEGFFREVVLRSEMKLLHEQLIDMQAAFCGLQEQNDVLNGEKSSLTSQVLNLSTEKSALEAEINALSDETMSEAFTFLIFKDAIFQKFSEIKEFQEIMRMDKVQLEGLLEKSEDDLKVVTSANDSLNSEIADRKMALSQMESRLSSANGEKSSLTSQVLNLSTEKSALEAKINALSDETMSEAFTYLVFKDAIFQNFSEIKEFQEIMQMDKVQLEGLLEKSEDDLKVVTSANDALNGEIADRKMALSQMESRLSAVEQMLKAFEMHKEDLLKELNDLKTQHLGLQEAKDEQHSQIQSLFQDYHDRSKELESTHEAKRELEVSLSKLLQEIEELKIREENLTHQLEKQNNEILQWEDQAAGYLSKGIITDIREGLLEDKIFELSDAYENRIKSQNLEVEELKGMVHTLEGQNAGQNDMVVGYISIVALLEKCVSSLESHTALYKECTDTDEAVQQSRFTGHHANEENSQEAVKNVSPVADGLSELRNLQRRIEAIEKAMLEREKLAAEESFSISAKLGDAMQEIERLKTEVAMAQERESEKLQDCVTNDMVLRKNKIEVNEAENELLTKDIMLDQVSECSSYSLSRRGTAEVGDQLLELGGTMEKLGQNNMYKDEAPKGHRSLNPSTDSLIDKELGVDKLDNFGSFSESNPETKKKKILERLNSDAQKLGNLQITVEDLKRKADTCEKGEKGMDFEIEEVKAQLEETEAAIEKLLDLNRNLVKNVEDGLFYSARSSRDFDNGTNISRRRISEQARRSYEKIGRLQVEVQKLQLLLTKLNEEKESRERMKVVDSKTRVLLRDYLYGGARGHQKRKKAGFCSCVQPSTRGD